MSQTLREQVTEFHEAMGAPVLRSPSVPPKERIAVRLKLVSEEFCEMLEAIGLPTTARSVRLRLFEFCDRALTDHDYAPWFNVDIVALADALADLDYVIEGTRLEFGINGGPIADAVHASNMAKVGSPVREDGKIQKPKGWQPPDIRGELLKQGWQP